MASQLDYFVAREQQADLARRAESARQSCLGELPESVLRGRLHALLAGLRRRDALQQRELPLAPGGVERAPVSASCLEIE